MPYTSLKLSFPFLASISLKKIETDPPRDTKTTAKATMDTPKFASLVKKLVDKAHSGKRIEGLKSTIQFRALAIAINTVKNDPMALSTLMESIPQLFVNAGYVWRDQVMQRVQIMDFNETVNVPEVNGFIKRSYLQTTSMHVATDSVFLEEIKTTYLMC